MLIKKAQNDYALVPAGLWLAQLKEVKDLGIVKKKFGEKQRICCTWETEIKSPDGKPYRVSKFYTPVLSAKSTLYVDLSNWLGSSVANSDALDLDSLIGKKAQILVSHVTKEDKTYANIISVMPALEKEAA